MTPLILDVCADGRAVVKVCQENDRPDAQDGSEDSDHEIESEQASGSAPEERVDKAEETKPETLPVLTVGSFARYAQHTLVKGLQLLSSATAGDLCSSICART